MSIQTFGMPDVGEGLTEAEILSWHVAVGDDITVNQIFVEIETAKAAVELPSPFAGRVQALLVEPGVTVPVGTPIISIDTAPGVSAHSAPIAAEPAPTANTDVESGSEVAAKTAAGVEPIGGVDPEVGVEPNGGVDPEVGAKIGEVTADGRIATLVGYVSAAAGTSRRPRRQPAEPAASTAHAAPARPGRQANPASAAPLAAPPVRKLAKELGVVLADLHPARADGVITRSEVEHAAGRLGAGSTAPADDHGAPRYDPRTREHRVPVKGVRKLTAQAMVASAFTAPHVTEFLTVDVTELMALRERLRHRPDFVEVKLSPLALVGRAACLAMRRTPEINAVWDGDAGEIVVKDYVHLGIAAATPRGLLVPNIRDADRMSVRELAVALAELTETARAGRTPPTAMTGGTFTITNVGVFGVDTGTPIINPGESAILALGSIKAAPWVVDGQLAVRQVCQLALSFDHRVVDGQQGSQFLADLGALMTDPGLALAF